VFHREIEADLLPYAREHNIGVLVYGPLAHGLLTGAMSPDTEFSDDDWRSLTTEFAGEKFERNLQVVERLKEVASQTGCTVSQLAIAWTLANPAVHVAIVGSRSRDHIEESIGAAEVSLSEGDLRAVEEIVADGVQLAGPSPEGMP
jgi:aryl-alcohol dehydrogenase-like predicted oxidoreductase